MNSPGSTGGSNSPVGWDREGPEPTLSSFKGWQLKGKGLCLEVALAVWLSRRFWTPGLLQRDVRTPLRTLMDAAGSHSQRCTPTSTVDLVWQGLLLPESVFALLAIRRNWCQFLLVLPGLSKGVLLT